jgi:two-component system, NtrC family, response regulator HupR/HoxA
MRRPRIRPKCQWRLFQPYTLRKKAERARPTLLIVDDDVQVLRVACRLLNDHWDIITAANAEEASAILRRTQFDTVLVDYEMPGENGIWLLSEIKRFHPHTRRVLFSGSQPMELRQNMGNGVVDCFVSKPTSREQLRDSLLR